MSSKTDFTKAKALTITYLTPVSFASLNGSDKEADNISSIKKISAGVEQYPYVSAQAVRRALRNQLEVMGWGNLGRRSSDHKERRRDDKARASEIHR